MIDRLKNMNNEKIDYMKTAKLLFKATRAIMSEGDYRKALELYQEIIASGNIVPDAYCGIAVCQKTLGNQEAAVAAAQDALRLKHDHFPTLQLLAAIYSNQGNDDLTYEYVSRALSCVPKSVAEMSPRFANFARKIAKFFLKVDPEIYVQKNLGLDEEDRIWIGWAREFKMEYEAKHSPHTKNE